MAEDVNFGQKTPPLTVYLKGILKRYPDGQIFKEMIQNADDAGAKTVWFYIDERSHGTSKLPHPDLARFQGPALVAANDAPFTDKDWKGIQTLQQSVKAKDPFKVGRFGIGFNSVYHLTDLPIIVSGKRLGCFEPQKEIWGGESSGKAFDIVDLIDESSDFIKPFYGIAGFDPSELKATDKGYSQTIFRLPLRKVASGLSESTYDPQKLQELLGALREESKYLLLFLKSICKIQVIHISRDTGQHGLSFCVEIAPDCMGDVITKRNDFMLQLRDAHARQPNTISSIISFTATFAIITTDNSPGSNLSGTTNWLIANYVGSDDQKVLAAAQKESRFPWVGTALELGENSKGGRIFCFLPMPVETSSGLPVHVNGTFGLNDERRSIQWPGNERKTDHTAKWNKMLVCQVLPHCYAMLLSEAKKHISPEQFYNAWPDVKVYKKSKSEFAEILQPLLTLLFKLPVFWTEPPEQNGEWIKVSKAIFINDTKDSKRPPLPSILKQVLSKCKVQLVTIPPVIWRAIQYAKPTIKEVSQMSTRARLRSNPGSYSDLNPSEKKMILTYCLSDSCYNDLKGLNLLPLANGSFTSFDKKFVYLCSLDYPRYLLPNLDGILADVSNDPDLNSCLKKVATSQQTKLRVLNDKGVANLLKQAFPSEWDKHSLVAMPNSKLPSTWLEDFWTWLKGTKNLQYFQDHLIVPCYNSTSCSKEHFQLAQLSSLQPVVYISNTHSSCSDLLFSALYKMKVSICLQSEFQFVQHRSLSKHLKQMSNVNHVLDAMYTQSSYKDIEFTPDEAKCMRAFLNSGPCSLTDSRREVLQNISIFKSDSNSSGKLYSLNTAKSISVIGQVVGKPRSFALSASNFPPTLILLICECTHQEKLLQDVMKIPFLPDHRLLIDHIIPMISKGCYPEELIDNLMSQVLDMFEVLRSKESNLIAVLQTLAFVKTIHGRKCPTELFDPNNIIIKDLYSGENVFPLIPYDTPHRTEILKYCGLRTTVNPQQILDIICSIGVSASSDPQQVDHSTFNRAIAVLKYIDQHSFLTETKSHYHLPGQSGRLCFVDALRWLASNRSWLPVISDKPSGHPKDIPWKGDGCSSHFVSLSSPGVVLPSPDINPCLVGSQVLVVPTVSNDISKCLSTDPTLFSQHVINHFKLMLNSKSQMTVDEVDSLVHLVYAYMNTQSSSCRSILYTLDKWIYIRRENKFVSSDVVAWKQNPTFRSRQHLEPYVYILPDSLIQYKNLFGPSSGVKSSVTPSQILSVLFAIKDEANSNCHTMSADDAWDLVTSILEWPKLKTSASVDHIYRLYVPVESDSDWPQLEEVSSVVYTKNEFVRRYLQKSPEKDFYSFVHKRIDLNLARALGVQPLSEHLDISENTFEDTGQQESLVNRLKTILRDYKKGLTIIKELLQNADDAEATEFNICFDARQHSQDKTELFLPGMVEAHGPALVVQNNKAFSEEDFKNITKLAGATKENKALKIGKFGIGFCSVYHMTDVPSFVSQDRLVIFDPTLQYLQNEIKNPAQPGKTIRFMNKLISSSEQLSPYEGLFGFDSRFVYNGTIFRFPFRSHTSELSETIYTKDNIQILISAIKKDGAKLLLFLQNLRTINFLQINPGQTKPEVILRVCKEIVPLPISLTPTTEIRNITCTDNECNACHWLVSQTIETDPEYYTASVACPLGTAGCYKVDSNFEGEIFCYLPLSQKTGLQVHISSNFAVINNRRGIWTSDDSEATYQMENEVIWNNSLMQCVIQQAYLAILSSLKNMAKANLLEEYVFHSLWPLSSNIEQHNPWDIMLAYLYPLLANSELFYSEYNHCWYTISESEFLDTGILLDNNEQSLDCVSKVCQKLKRPIVNLPREYLTNFMDSLNFVDETTFMQLFFDNFSALDDISEARNLVIRHMLEVYASECDDSTSRCYALQSWLESQACIPCTPDGSLFRYCSKVIDPFAKFAELFDDSDSYFPVTELSDRNLAMTALRKLGMINEYIPWDILLERAETIPVLYQNDREKALSCVKLILNANTITEPQGMTVSRSLDSIPFLPVVQIPPQDYPLAWKGEDRQLMCGQELVRLRQNGLTAGSQVYFVCESPTTEGGCGYISNRMLKVLSIQESPTIDQVIKHLQDLIEHVTEQYAPSEKLLSWTTNSCKLIYEVLNDKLKETSRTHHTTYYSHEPTETSKLEVEVVLLKSAACVWTGKKFVESEMVIKNWTRRNGPYIYSLPESLSNLTLLTDAIGIKEELAFKDIQQALEQMKNDFQRQPVNEECRKLLRSLVSPLLNVADLSKDIFLPGEDFVMHHSHDLSYNDAPWLPRDDQYMYVHNMIPRELAEQLGVNPVRSRMLEDFVSHHDQFGVPFGQQEKLTSRIQSILREYPFDVTVLKELLQNADDAKATKMFVILDKRNHKTNSILSESWADLQGPSLLVWNDSEFTEADLQGIQRLGVGRKRDDDESIGQFGIGFNVVYHLTDCPSFISGGETMCVFDPHCKYVHGAKEDKPGRRYDQLTKKKFWDKFPDIKTAFLRDKLKNAPDMSKGSLFRFPLRSTLRLVEESEILPHSLRSTELVIDATTMNRKLTTWAIQMKDAMLFLNHVCELCFFTIEENSLFKTYKHFKTSINEHSQKSRTSFHSSMSNFTHECENVSSLVKYPLTLSEISHYAYNKDQQDEKWLIQQGIGDIGNEKQSWKFIETVKPRHGIAAPLTLIEPKEQAATSSYYGPGRKVTVSREKFSGAVFCFLPLPGKCKLPVHINANFILHSNRRSLWRPTDASIVDDKTKWNVSLFEAIASSYADFLSNSRTNYVVSDSFAKYHEALKQLDWFYEVFPSAKPKDLEEPYLQLAKNVYKALVNKNAPIIGVISAASPKSQDRKFRVFWHPIKSDDPSDQIYFCKNLEKDQSIIIESLGMKLTKAPLKIQACINAQIEEETDKVKQTTRESVFSYYRQFSHKVSETGTFPCELKRTVFKTMESFLLFLKYLLKPSEEHPHIHVFPDYPFGCPLIVTADETLLEAHQIDKVINSKFYHLFPNSADKFLHPELLKVPFSQDLFVCVDTLITSTSEELELSLPHESMPEYALLKHILARELPSELDNCLVYEDYKLLISEEKIKSLWECFTGDKTFKFFLQTIAKQFAIVPTTSGCLYSTNNQIRPICSLGSEGIFAFRYSISEADIQSAFNALSHIGLPFTDSSAICDASLTDCPTLFDADIILEYVFHMNEQEDISQHFNHDLVVALINYFKAIDFNTDLISLNYIKALPLFENTDNSFTVLEGKIVYVWPNKVCTIGYQKWLQKYDGVVFLKQDGSWTKLGSADELQLKKLSAEQVYTKFIFPAFSQLSEKERYYHLKHIKNKLFDRLFDQYTSGSQNLDDCKQSTHEVKFLCDLRNLPCIGGDDDLLHPVRDFCSHKIKVFKTFETYYRFLPDFFIHNPKKPHLTDSWLKFFESIGLQVCLTTNEYLKLCTDISRGRHNNPEKGSKVLIEYLFSDAVREKLKWHKKVEFLHSLADLAFICTEQQPKYEWICPAAKPCNRIKSGDKYIGMTKFKEATLANQAHLLWTVKSVISLPGYNPYLAREEDEQILKHLQLAQGATPSLVIHNIQNVALFVS